ncbi:MAG: hypothetical protein WBC70_15050 [Candidatus Aminicenantales bacterium]
MPKKISSPQFAGIVILGAVWGFSEAALGLGLKRCAAVASGSIMTAVALLFIAAAWVLVGRVSGVILMVALATLIKLFDAQLLSLPLIHGAVANPIFAFWMEALAFLVIIVLLKNSLLTKRYGQAALGGIAALLAVNVFPLVRFATGIPACVVPGTAYPLSLYYLPFAVGLSLVTVPVGFWLGERLTVTEAQHEAFILGKAFRYLVSPGVLILSLLAIAAFRLAG